MPSNKDLKTEAEELAKELKLTISTEGLSNNDLTNLVADMKAKKRDAELETQADEELKPEPEVEKAKVEAPEVEKAQHEIAKGKSITTKRGILKGGAEIKAGDLGGGEKSLNELVDAGYVVKN